MISFPAQVIPRAVQEKWQKELEAMDAQLGGTKEKPVSSLLVMLEAPEEMVIVCTTGGWGSCGSVAIVLYSRVGAGVLGWLVS